MGQHLGRNKIIIVQENNYKGSFPLLSIFYYENIRSWFITSNFLFHSSVISRDILRNQKKVHLSPYSLKHGPHSHVVCSHICNPEFHISCMYFFMPTQHISGLHNLRTISACSTFISLMSRCMGLSTFSVCIAQINNKQMSKMGG